ncbi:hypothetical protein BKA67DRAFT_5138 [Truncatella angustata]|uniref:Uncharacterized protein n=1 Tax=Truncatella angustata TaxID=152316 RepID=A0A9P8UVP7_9PEZI|nr:uncharacterized protein BKA67DRAFT_5138 [Truncatella angustata]KAH6659063.1 hypothetical protein BKA67DRAFT_5138 [Truncatella angustata]
MFLPCATKREQTVLTHAQVPCPACPPQTNPIACPALAVLTTLQVPCSTDCCPTTSTTYLPGTCPPCGQCVIPTYTSTVTTGCPVSSHGYPTKTA